MNEVVSALPLVASVMWSLRPRPPVRRPASATDPVPRSVPHRPLRGRIRRRRDHVDATELALWCEEVARRVRGGDALRTAIERVGSDGAAATTVSPILRRIGPNGEVTAGYGSRPRDPGVEPRLHPDAALVVAVLTACIEQGGPAAEPLDRTAGVLRSRAAERAERRVQSAQARLSATVLTWLPVAMLIVLVTTSAAVRSVVVARTGLVVVAAGSILNLAGWWWMRRIVERASR